MHLKDCITLYISQNLNKNDVKINDFLRIYAHMKDVSLSFVYTNLDSIILSEDEKNTYVLDLDKYYKQNIPLQYILEIQPFYNENYIVNEDVLVPRADTEILVENAIKYIIKFKLKNMIDMCTGSGCVGISVARNSIIAGKYALNEVYLVDVSKKALKVAKENIKLNGLLDYDIKLINSDMFNYFLNTQSKKYINRFDIIVSNPPYIRTKDIDGLDKHVKSEPLIALDGGEDGLYFYNIILKESPQILRDGGFLLFEIGYDQLDDFKKLILEYKKFEFVECIKDLSGNDRVVVCRFHQQ